MSTQPFEALLRSKKFIRLFLLSAVLLTVTTDAQSQDSADTQYYKSSIWRNHIFNGKNTLELNVLRQLQSMYYFDEQKLWTGFHTANQVKNKFAISKKELAHFYLFQTIGLDVRSIKRLFGSFSYTRQLGKKHHVFFTFNAVKCYINFKPRIDMPLERLSRLHDIGYKYLLWSSSRVKFLGGASATYRGGGELRVSRYRIVGFYGKNNEPAYEYGFYDINFKDIGTSLHGAIHYAFKNGLGFSYRLRYSIFPVKEDPRSPFHYFGSNFWIGYSF